jgi:hypothetical protein
MPYALRKMPKRNCYKVFNKNTKKIFSKCTSMKNAQKQLRLLRALQNNKKFRSNFKRKTMRNVGGKTRKKYNMV